MLLANREGIVVTSPIVALVPGGAATSLLVFTIPILGGQLIGLKSAKILKVILCNNAAGNVTVLIGNGAVGVGIPALLPALDSMNNLTATYAAINDFPEVESFASIVAWTPAVAGTIDIQLELLICG